MDYREQILNSSEMPRKFHLFLIGLFRKLIERMFCNFAWASFYDASKFRTFFRNISSDFTLYLRIRNILRANIFWK